MSAPSKVQKVDVPDSSFARHEHGHFEVSTGDKPVIKPDGHSTHVLIIGGGVSGLLAAWMLLDKGIRVTILAKEWARTWDFSESRITSQIAGALWEMPPGGCGLTEIESPGKGWATVEHYREWAMQSFHFYNKYMKISDEHEKEGHSLGLSIAKLHQFFYEDIVSDCDDPTSSRYDHHVKYLTVQEKCQEGFSAYGSEEEIKNKFDEKFINLKYGGKAFQSGYTHRAPILNTDKALAYLMALVQRKGATLETREVEDLRNTGRQLLTDFNADVILNATGLGAKDLVKDEDVYPVRGAIRRVDNVRHGQFRHLNDAYLVPAQIGPDEQPSKTVFIVPRSDEILYVGSIIQPHNNNKNLTPESPEVLQMWDRAGDFMPSLRHAAFLNHFPFAQGLRPFTKKNVKVRADEDFGFPLVHNYGHGGSGWTLGVGTAQCAVYIIEKLVGDKKHFLTAVETSKFSPQEKKDITNGIKNGDLDHKYQPKLLQAVEQSSLTPGQKKRSKEVLNAWIAPARLIDASAKVTNKAMYEKKKD
jgi:glycine/D-amino acid oxidase-like deaminating enzyme